MLVRSLLVKLCQQLLIIQVMVFVQFKMKLLPNMIVLVVNIIKQCVTNIKTKKRLWLLITQALVVLIVPLNLLNKKAVVGKIIYRAKRNNILRKSIQQPSLKI